MKILKVKALAITLSTLCISSMALANHPVEANIEIDRESLNRVRLSQVQLHHDDDGKYRLRGKVRRRQKLHVPPGHLDLVALNLPDGEEYEESQYYWPRIVNRQKRRPSRFVFTIPENTINTATLKLSFHRNKFANKPTPRH